MHSDFRKSSRVFPKDFIDYKVNLVLGDSVYQGHLGNISENGMCAVMGTDFQPHENQILEGSIYYAPVDDTMVIKGRVVWKSEYKHQNKAPQNMIGMEFAEKIVFPEYLLAQTMAIEDQD